MEADFAPLGETRLQQLLDAVAAEGDAAETLGLEAKSDIDPSKKGLGIAKIAKFILGMANRMPEVAVRYFKGHGVMLIGAEKGHCPGIPKGVEAHELANRLKPYLGPDGPRWDLARLSTSDSHEVLFVLVDPPSPGQPLYLCHKDYQPADRADAKFSLTDGDIYVRDKTQTRKATASEVQALLRRGTPIAPEVTFDFQVLGRALGVTDTDSGLRGIMAATAERTRKEAEEEKRVAEEKKREAEASARKKAEEARQKWAVEGRPMPAMSQSAFESMMKAVNPLASQWRTQSSLFGVPETEDSHDPEDIIRRREERWWKRWPKCRENLYSATAERIRFAVENQVASYLSQPQIVVTINGARAVEPQDADDLKVHQVLPFEDEPGSRTGPYGFALPDLVDYRAFRRANPEIDWTDNLDGSVTVVLTPSALRPSTRWTSDDDELVLIALDPAATELSATWSLTAEGIGQRFDGEFIIPVQRVDDAVELMRAYVATLDRA